MCFVGDLAGQSAKEQSVGTRKCEDSVSSTWLSLRGSFNRIFATLLRGEMALKVFICGSIGTGWGSYTKNLLSSMNSNVEFTFPSYWLKYWQFSENSLNGKPTKSFRVPISTSFVARLLSSQHKTDFPRLELLAVNADVIHSNCRLLLTQRPYVLVFDTPWLLTTLRSYRGEPNYGSIGKLVCNHIALKKCVKVLPASTAAKQEFLRMTSLHDDPALIEVLPPGIEIPQLQKEYRSEEKIELLFVGRNFWRKGGVVLLTAFQDLSRKFSNVHLTIKTARKDIVIPPSIQEKVNLIDAEISPDQLNSLYASADIFVFPTLDEPYGRAICEAMAYGLPVVASDHYAIPEIITDCVPGFLFKTGSVDDLVSKLGLLILDPMLRRRMGKAAREKAILKSSNSVVNERLYSIYLESVQS